MSTDGLSQVEQEAQGLCGPSRPVIVREDNTQEDARQQRSMPLCAPLTGNLLFTMSWLVGLGIPKAIYANRGQSLISPKLDWVGGIILTLISLWLAAIEAKRPELYPRFFQIDLAPFILNFLRRHDVHLWFASVLPLLLVAEVLSIAEHEKRWLTKYATSEITELDEAGYNAVVWVMNLYEVGLPSSAVLLLAEYYMDGPTIVAEVQFHEDGPTQLVLGTSMAVFLFFLHGLRVLYPRSFIKVKWFYGSLISIWMCVHVLFLVVRCFTNDSDISNFMISMTLRLYFWMMPWASPLFLEQFGFFSGKTRVLQHFAKYCNVIFCVCPAIWEAIWGPPVFPRTLYRLLFLCFALVPIWGSFSAIIPPFWVTWVTSACEAAYDGVRSAGTKAREYVLGVRNRVRSAGREAWVSVSRIYDQIRRGTLVFVY